MKKVNTAVFPVDINYIAMIENPALQMDDIMFEVKQWISFSGWNTKSFYENTDCYKISCLEEGLDADVEALVLIDTLHILELEYLEAVIAMAAGNGITVFNARSTDLQEEESIKELCRKYQTEYRLIQENYVPGPLNNYELKEIEAPVVSVVGTGPNTQIFDVELQLYGEFKKAGHKISYISSRRAGRLLGAHCIPDFMYDTRAEREKILLLNRFVYETAAAEKPDLILLGVPGEIMPLSRKHSLNFGIVSYEIFSAVTPDVSILGLYNLEYTDAFIEREKAYCKYHLNMEPDIIFCSNVGILEHSLRESVIQYFYADGVYGKSLDKYRIYSYKELMEGAVYQKVVDKLSEYGTMNFM